MTPPRFKIRRDGPPLRPWTLRRSDPITGWVKLHDYQTFDAAVRGMDSVGLVTARAAMVMGHA